MLDIATILAIVAKFTDRMRGANCSNEGISESVDEYSSDLRLFR